jgi:uncharacterized circularly permuted ATP-grasp superfamily protein/uncharacterized alpha-E superfamily protein
VSAVENTTGDADSLIAGYSPLPGVADELIDSSGQVRPVWRDFVGFLSSLNHDEVGQRFARGDQYLRDAGVFYRQYGDALAGERDWPLSHVPLLIHENEWAEISAALVERADLLEDVVADLYGENKLVAEGHLPASLVAMTPEWLRPMVGVKPRGHFLNFIGFEIGRGPDGKWWVLGDRVQAPSGAGFALENRVATSRVFPDFYAEANVHRLAGFFRVFRDSLQALRTESDSRVGVLTPGRLNDTYFEHAYIARYLGFDLLEGEDLTVEDGRVMVRTIAGLRPVSVLWRRLDSSYADPLELDETSRLGTPGLVESIRQGRLAMVNALGVGVLETRALLAFLPRICEALRGKPLAMPNIATWWCGQAAERAHVRANADRMMIGPAFSTRLPFDMDDATLLGARLRARGGESLSALLDTDGVKLVGQEAVKLSTTPVWHQGKLIPRPMSLRIFLARDGAGWRVMAGGYARIGGTEDASAIAMQRGGSVADVWIMSDSKVDPTTMLPPPAAPYTRAEPGVLPSRAADNLFWLGRYVERAEGVMRLLRAYHIRLAETAEPNAPLLRWTRDHLDLYDIDPADGVPEQLRATLASAIGSASRVRDRFSVDGWMAINDLAKTSRRMAATVKPGDDAASAMSVLLRKITGFSGLVHDNMYRSMGWRFLTIGRSLERGMMMASALAHFADPDAPDGSLDLAVEFGDSEMSYRQRYAVATGRRTVIDLLACDDHNPRSIVHHLEELRDQIELLPGSPNRNGQVQNAHASPAARAARLAHAGLFAREPDTLDEAALLEIRSNLAELSDLLSSAYLS